VHSQRALQYFSPALGVVTDKLSVTTLIVKFGRAFMRICQHSANFAVLRTQLVPSESTHIPPRLCTDDHEDARPQGKRQMVSLVLDVKHVSRLREGPERPAQAHIEHAAQAAPSAPRYGKLIATHLHSQSSRRLTRQVCLQVRNTSIVSNTLT